MRRFTAQVLQLREHSPPHRMWLLCGAVRIGLGEVHEENDANSTHAYRAHGFWPFGRQTSLNVIWLALLPVCR
jgi:hypothetical protein